MKDYYGTLGLDKLEQSSSKIKEFAVYKLLEDYFAEDNELFREDYEAFRILYTKKSKHDYDKALVENTEYAFKENFYSSKADIVWNELNEDIDSQMFIAEKKKKNAVRSLIISIILILLILIFIVIFAFSVKGQGDTSTIRVAVMCAGFSLSASMSKAIYDIKAYSKKIKRKRDITLQSLNTIIDKYVVKSDEEWVCRKCGKSYPGYIGSCKCGCSRYESFADDNA